MKKAIVVDANDIKAILAEKYVIKSQYSYTVILPESEQDSE